MIEILVRFLVGGVVVSAFAVIGDVIKPKSFAGLFGAAPWGALATLGLTIASKGPAYVATEAHSMIAGVIAFFIYASVVSWIMMQYKVKAILGTLYAMPLWFGVAFSVWRLWLK